MMLTPLGLLVHCHACDTVSHGFLPREYWRTQVHRRQRWGTWCQQSPSAMEGTYRGFGKFLLGKDWREQVCRTAQAVYCSKLAGECWPMLGPAGGLCIQTGGRGGKQCLPSLLFLEKPPKVLCPDPPAYALRSVKKIQLYILGIFQLPLPCCTLLGLFVILFNGTQFPLAL